MTLGPYDALLLVSFGGPEGPGDVLPFLENVTRGRGIPQERLREVGAHYDHFGGVSPINAQNRALLSAIRADLAAHDIELPVFWGNRNWAPYLSDALTEMSAGGVRRALCFVTSAYSSYSGCRQYRENLADALDSVAAEGRSSIELEKLRVYFDHPGFIGPWVDSTVDALERLPEDVRSHAALVFTTHSIPVAQADTSGPHGGAYVAQHELVADLVTSAVGERTCITDRRSDLVYQSRSGPPTQPWLEPDVGDHLAALAADGVAAAVLAPIGFVSDHVEVRWDLDHEAAQQAAELGMAVTRAETPGVDPRFVSMIRDLILERIQGVEPHALGPDGPSWDTCLATCCPNPRGPRPAVSEVLP